MTGPHSDYHRRGRLVRLFTQDEDERLEAMRLAGMTLRAIATALGRAHSSVQMRLRSLAAHVPDDQW